MKRKILMGVVLIVLCGAAALLYYTKRPYGFLEADQVQSVQFFYSGCAAYEGVTGTELEDDDIDRCVQALNNLKGFRRTSKPLEPYVGASREGFDVLLKDGKQMSIYLYVDFVIVNGDWYHADRRSCNELDLFFYKLLANYFPDHEERAYFYGSLKSLYMWFEVNGGDSAPEEQAPFLDFEIPKPDKNDKSLEFYYHDEHTVHEEVPFDFDVQDYSAIDSYITSRIDPIFELSEYEKYPYPDDEKNGKVLLTYLVNGIETDVEIKFFVKDGFVTRIVTNGNRYDIKYIVCPADAGISEEKLRELALKESGLDLDKYKVDHQIVKAKIDSETGELYYLVITDFEEVETGSLFSKKYEYRMK